MKFLTSMLALSLLMVAAPVLADDVTTTTTTVQTTNIPEYVLPATGTYLVVDPAGTMMGKWLLGQPYTQGSYVIEQASGRVVASVADGGHLVAVTTLPTTYPTTQYVVTNGYLIYSGTSDYAKRRVVLDQEIQANYQAGHLTNEQVGKLKEKLAKVERLEQKRKGDMTYSSSTVREIEEAFADVKGEMAKDIASTNSKKAGMGLKVD